MTINWMQMTRLGVGVLLTLGMTTQLPGEENGMAEVELGVTGQAESNQEASASAQVDERLLKKMDAGGGSNLTAEVGLEGDVGLKADAGVDLTLDFLSEVESEPEEEPAPTASPTQAPAPTLGLQEPPAEEPPAEEASDAEVAGEVGLAAEAAAEVGTEVNGITAETETETEAETTGGVEVKVDLPLGGLIVSPTEGLGLSGALHVGSR